MKVKIAIFLSSLYAASAVHADNFYVVGSVGQSQYRDSNKAADDALAASAGLTADGSAEVASNIDNTDTGYKLQLGYSINPNLAVEGGYVNLGEQSYRVNFSTGQGEARVDDRGLNIDAVGILPVNDAFSVFGKLGMIDAKTNYHLSGSDAGGEIVDSHEAYKLRPTFGVGASYAINDVVGTRLELERFADLGKQNTTGEQNVDLLSLGITYQFK